MIAKQAYIIVGNDRTGKTTLQKRLVKHLCNVEVKKLNTNKLYEVTHPMAPKQLYDISLMNRSFQEKLNEYGSIKEYFINHFAKADVVILSSHLISSDVQEILYEARKLFFNVNLVLLENSLETESELLEKITNWPEWKSIIVLPNPITTNEAEIETQLDNAASLLTANIIDNAKLC